MSRRWGAILLSLGVAVHGLLAMSTLTMAEEASKGGIKGTVEASGVRSPENVVIYVEEAPGEFEPPSKPIEMDQVKLMFVPHVLPVVSGTTVKFVNSDPVLHNVFWPKSKSYTSRNLGTWGKGGSKEYKFDKLGSVVTLCNVHPEMEGHIVILQNPFFAVVDKDGEYEIKDVPSGEYTLVTWYTNPKKLRSKTAKVVVKANEATEQNFSLSRKR